MKKLLSLPENLVDQFHSLANKCSKEYFCASDPVGKKVGSGGGTAWILNQCWKEEDTSCFNSWLSSEKRVIIHAGGQSRRLPAYAASGKVLCPIPVFRWERGQKLDQNLLDLQLPLYEKIIKQSPRDVNTLIASGDVYIRSEGELPEMPEADVICYGLWGAPELASNHGVFVCDKHNNELKYMLQKPSVDRLKQEQGSSYCLMDIGIWLLSDRAVELLMKSSGCYGDADCEPNYYDLYGELGLALGSDPSNFDEELSQLKVAILPLDKGEFYHYGTSPELISSTLKIQNKVTDQRSILHNDSKPHPSIFVQNARIDIELNRKNENVWIENSHIADSWKIGANHVLTGIPENSWSISLTDGICVDIVPIGEQEVAVRCYGVKDAFRGAVNDDATEWMGASLKEWMADRSLMLSAAFNEIDGDIQSQPLFPVVNEDRLEDMLKWMVDASATDCAQEWLESKRLSADELAADANLTRLFEQRRDFMNGNLPLLKKNSDKSIFYQLNLDDLAKKWSDSDQPEIESGSVVNAPLKQMQEHMFRARVKQYSGTDFSGEEQMAFGVLNNHVINEAKEHAVLPRFSVFRDQIVWGRSPIRIDFAGGWSDTPPYCLAQGGKVVNAAFNLNGQPPLQVFVRPCEEKHIVLRSIDLGTREIVETWEQLEDYKHVGSEFSIGKAALSLVGFAPDFCSKQYASLKEQLAEFDSGIEVSTLAAIPKGSGLGTSSILASTVLGALADFCGLNWDKFTICQKTLVLEQMLTTGGGWQDQFGGVNPGVKLIESSAGLIQAPSFKWAPDFFFTNPEFRSRMLLYYTGITRTAKDILSEIVRGMFLNNSDQLELLKDMKAHALHTFDVIQRGDVDQFAECINRTWQHKQQIDAGTNPEAVQNLIAQFSDLASAYKLPGAGGGGYMFIIAKDVDAAGKIRQILTKNPPNSRARFVDIELSTTGLQVTRS